MKKRNRQDLTLRNLRAMKKLIKILSSKLNKLEAKIKVLWRNRGK